MRWLLALAAILVACGGDDTGGGSGSGGSTGSAGASVGGGGGGMVEDCEPFDACQECGAMACPEERAECCSTPGCPTIIACGREKNCNGLDCYKPETCQQVIDENGGPLGDATAAAAPLGECAAMHCDECPQPPM